MCIQSIFLSIFLIFRKQFAKLAELLFDLEGVRVYNEYNFEEEENT